MYCLILEKRTTSDQGQLIKLKFNQEKVNSSRGGDYVINMFTRIAQLFVKIKRNKDYETIQVFKVCIISKGLIK